MNVALQDGLREHRIDRQFTLVREHWVSVRRLWAETSSLSPTEALGDLPPDFWTGCGMPGLATVTAVAHRFEFTDTGREAAILPCYDTIPGLVVASAERHVEELRDLVAVDIDHPDRFWRCRGEALVLGNAYLEIAGQEGAPVPVYRNPLTWFRAAGDGIVVLDWDWAREMLTGLDLVAEDLALGEQLEAALKPDIWIAA